ncbi:MAG TPA: TetR/AcrR family transcriptional regulator [Azospirillum sp.]|nr:TetR/AcrR family transcriptional regulator [Azospirillum sp.]
MRYSKEHKEQSRARILETASRLFRERGLEGIGVADLMKAAGLTHGGFYGHFASKDALVAEAVREALTTGRAALAKAARSGAGPEGLRALLDLYLSPRHRDAPGAGCAIAALGAEALRAAPETRHAFTEGIEALAALVADTLPEGSPGGPDRRERALATVATMVGAMVMARAVDDPTLSEEILEAAKAGAKAGAGG